MQSLTVKIINQSANEIPSYATKGAAGMDLRAHLAEPLLLAPLQRILVPTGLFLEIPEGYEAQIRPRSGLAIQQGITCLNTPGTIDSDYRGEVKVILINLGQQSHAIQPGDRIAQMVFNKVEQVRFELAVNLEETDRGTGGFGHTGKK